MLTQPRGNLHERHRQHRRQISTPSALEAAKAPSLPAQALQRYHAHRRGQSFDQRSLHNRRPQSVQDGSLSITNTTVPQQHQPMPVMSECASYSQEQVQAFANRSGSTHQPRMPYMNPAYVKMGDQGLEDRPVNNTFNGLQQPQFQQSKVPCGSAMNDQQFLDHGAWDMFQQDMMASGLQQQQPNAIPADMRRLSVQSDLNLAQQPHTPKPTPAEYLPITPATTPFNKSVDIARYDVQPSPTKHQRFSVPSSAQAAYMQRARSLQGVAGTSFSQPRIDMPSPPNTASFDVESFDAFDCQQGSSFEVPMSDNSSRSHYASSSVASSFMSSPELVAMPLPPDDEKPQKVPILPATPSRATPKKAMSTSSSASTSKSKLSPKAASIDNLNLDDRVHASIKETGVTIDEIAAYIQGPDPEDGKWMCLHPGCERRFGRKENIKSHVQTHLGDRQYKCDHCNKCFVRGHDLKRHAKIHTGDKPYECLCGNVFARHDALTRHRQRGMCIGGYKGIVRKTTKRGRPKKHRPELEDRQDKSAKTRQRIAEKMTYDSSASDMSRSSPPSDFFEHMSLHGSSPSQEMPVFSNPDYSLPPDVFTFTPPASPRDSIGHKSSPSRLQRSLTPTTEDELLPLSPSKHGLEKISEEGLPFLSDKGVCPYTEAANSTVQALSSPHPAPPLSDSNGSDLDIFINQDTTTFGKTEFSDMTDSGMATFPDYVNPTSFDSGLDLFPGKGFSAAPPMGDDFFSFQFQVDDQPSDVMSREFFMD